MFATTENAAAAHPDIAITGSLMERLGQQAAQPAFKYSLSQSVQVNSSDKWRELLEKYREHLKDADLDDFSEDNNYLPGIHPAVKIVLIVTFLLVIGLCGFGNTLLTVTILRLKRLRSVTNLFLASLALSDALVAILCAPFTLHYYLLQNWIFGDFMCSFVGSVKIVSLNVSVNTLLVIALERYYVIHNPMKPRLSKGKVLLITVLTWIVSVAVTVPTPLNISTSTGIDKYGNRITTCAEYWHDNVAGRSYILFLAVAEYLLPMATMIVAYWMIVRKVWFRKTLGDATDRQRELACGNRKKTIRMLIIVVASFSFCWGPYYAYNITVHFNEGILMAGDNNMTAYYVVEVIAMSSCFMNTIVFFLMNESFRRECLSLFGKLHCVKLTFNTNSAANASFVRNVTRISANKTGTLETNL